ncbi:nucleoside transporter, NupC family [Chromobacterium violaceum]|uniref:Nucleoside transporter, NupC family n=1 Tax=Chromobacterium violaceum TaxID=536 RepID=A0A3S4LHI2_CHRVL|nr:nucleoside transporter, NupC family [Chromobacterium violaceum]
MILRGARHPGLDGADTPPIASPRASVNTIQALAGMLLLIAAAYLFSTNRRAVKWRTVLIGLAIQNGLFLLINYVPPSTTASPPSAPASPRC